MKTEWEVTYDADADGYVLEVNGVLGSNEWLWRVYEMPKQDVRAGGEATSAASAMRSAEQIVERLRAADPTYAAPHPDRKYGCHCPVRDGGITHRLGCRYFASERRAALRRAKRRVRR